MATASETYPDFERQALTLPLQERSRLANILLGSLDQEDGPLLASEWENEINRRIKDIDNGTVRLIPHEEVMARFEAQLHARGDAGLVWHPDADAEFDESGNYYEARQAGLGFRMGRAVLASLGGNHDRPRTVSCPHSAADASG